MRGIIFLMFLFYSGFTYSDSGNAYRFLIKIKHNETEYKGYTYHYSYDEYKESMPLLEYLRKTSTSTELEIFSNIKTVNINSDYDFAVNGSEKVLSIDNNIIITCLEVLKFPVGDRLIMVSEEEYKLILTKQPKYVIKIDEGKLFQENCSIILISWEKKNSIKKIGQKIVTEVYSMSNKISKTENTYIDEFWKLFNKKKREVFNKKGLLFMPCSAL